jgi:hypothetical protein
MNKLFGTKVFGVIFILLMSFFILGCGNSNSGSGNVDYNFEQGVADLKISFLKNSPPDKIYAGSNFKIIAELDNQAAYDLKNIGVKIIGLDSTYFGIYPGEENVNLLLGRSLTNPAGEKTFLEFEGTAGKPLQNAEKYLGQFSLNVNYDSSIEFADTICINPNLYEVYDSGCKVEDKKSYSGQGAPLAVTKLEEIISPGSSSEVEFRFILKNKGKGKVGTITLGKRLLGNENLICHFKGEKENRLEEGVELIKIKMDEKQEAILICQKPLLENLNSFMTTLNLDFTYDYEIKQKNKLNLLK